MSVGHGEAVNLAIESKPPSIEPMYPRDPTRRRAGRLRQRELDPSIHPQYDSHRLPIPAKPRPPHLCGDLVPRPVPVASERRRELRQHIVDRQRVGGEEIRASNATVAARSFISASCRSNLSIRAPGRAAPGSKPHPSDKTHAVSACKRHASWSMKSGLVTELNSLSLRKRRASRVAL